MQERNITKCKKCNIIKVRILIAKIGKDKIWADENGIRWNGKTCPDCHKALVWEKTQARRSTK